MFRNFGELWRVLRRGGLGLVLGRFFGLEGEFEFRSLGGGDVGF